MAKKIANYTHFVPPARMKPDKPGSNEHVLVISIEMLKGIIEENKDKKFMSFDVETSGLDAEVDFIVGYSFAFSSTKGYYVPVKHIKGISLGEEALELIYKRMLASTTNFLYNTRFDFRMMEYSDGHYNMENVSQYDVSIGIWLADTNISMPSLKWAEKHFLGWNPDTFEETLGDNVNMYYMDPEEVYSYACVDAEGTFGLVPISVKFWKEAKISGKIDNDLIYPLMTWENKGVIIDTDYLKELSEKIHPQIRDLEYQIYSEVGYQFNIGSNKQLGDALQSVGINTGEYTATGLMKTDIKTLETLARRLGDTPDTKLLNNLIKRSQLTKLVGSYVDSLHDEAIRQGGRCRFSYLNTRVPTGRLACGSDKKNDFFANINEQSIPKPHPAMWYVHRREDIEGELDENEIELFDWVFSLTRKGKYWMEGFTLENNVRKAFKPEKDALWVSIDFNAQELRIPAALSGEPAWVVPFQTGKDVHRSCYYEDTEYLTMEGWKLAKEINPKTMIAQYLEGKMEFVRAGLRYKGESGELIRFKSGLIDCLVTKNHRMLVGYNETEPIFKTAEEVYEEGKGFEFYIGATYKGDINWERGTYRDIGNYRVCIENFIDDLATSIRIGEYPSNCDLGNEINSMIKRDGIVKIPEEIMRNNLWVRREFLVSYSRAQLLDKKGWEYFLKKGFVVKGLNEVVTDQLQILATSLGYRAIKVNKEEVRINSKGIFVRAKNITKEIWSRNTYCFSVPSGVLITRRNGKITIAGNTAEQVWGAENYNKDYRKKAKVMNFCETANNWILTDSGYKRVYKVLPTDRLMNKYGDAQEFRLEKRDNKPCIDVEFSNGVKARYHENHYFQVWDGYQMCWMPLKDIEDEQIIGYAKSCSSKLIFHKGNREVSEAYAYGLFLGDGWRVSSKKVGICLNKDYLDVYRSRLPGIWREEESSSSKCKNVFIDLDTEKWYKDGRKCIPDEVMTWSQERREALLSGLIDTDGSTHGKSLIFENTNKELIDNVIILAVSLGIRTTLKSVKPGVTEDGKRRYTDKEGKEYSRLWIVHFVEQQDLNLPLTLKYKRDKQRSYGGMRGWKVIPERYEGAYSLAVYENGYSGVSVTLDNLRRGRQKNLTAVKLEECEVYAQTGLSREYYPVTILKKELVKDTIWAFEVESHEYVSSGVVSHNSQLYGGNKYTVQSKLGIDDLDECQKLVDDFHKGLPTIFGYLDAIVRKARKEGTVYTYFGRPRRVRFYLNSPDSRVRAFGARTVKNSKIQGTGADLTKLGMLRSWRNLCNPKIHKHSRFLSQIHDELNYSIDKEYFDELLPLAIKSMRIQVQGWAIPMEVGVEIGPSWGETFKFKVKEDGSLYPDYEEVPEEEIIQSEEPLVEDEDNNEDIFMM